MLCLFNRIMFFTIGLMCLALTGCEDIPNASEYFPAERNIYWVYSGYQNNWRLVNNDFIYVIHNADVNQADDGGTLLEKKRHNNTQLTYLLNDEGIFTISESVSGSKKSGKYQDMLLPRKPDLHKQWTRRVRTRLIPEFACGYCTTTTELKQLITINYSIVATDAAIETPMGKFKDCILVEGQGVETIDAGDSMGKVDVQVSTREWYAPDVGLVKLEWREQTNEEILKVGEYRLELKDMYYH